MATESILIMRKANKHKIMRRTAVAVGAAYALVFPLATGSIQSPVTLAIGTIINVLLAGGACVFAFKAARHFDRGETGRRVWLLIAFMALADCGVLITFTVPRITTAFEGAVVLLTLLTSTLTAISRGVLLPLALWMMVRVYRGIGLGFHLERWDYIPMAFFAGLGVLSLALVGSIARSQLYISDPRLTLWLRTIGFLLLPALVISSVLGVMIWRYTKQMGGGLVAKAWQAVLWCTVLWLARFTFLGVLTRWFGVEGSARPEWVEIVSFWTVIAMECALFYGASFQYEACSAAVDIHEEEGSSIGAAQVD